MQLGVAYYPEQWEPSRWATDARLMIEAGLTIVRIGEFAWSVLEPEPGRYCWDWLDEAIAVLHTAGLGVIVGTPTAAPPAWLAADNPAVLPVRADGRLAQFGGRRHYCPSSPVYRAACAAIVTAEARHLAARPGLIGWQVDNEFGNHESARCFCDRCRAAFHAWLQTRYDTLESLNTAWGTRFWSQHYTAWAQIPMPTGAVVALHSPSLCLDYYRFASDLTVDFCRAQAGILRDHTPDLPITTNVFPGDEQLDFHALAGAVDFLSWDNYPHGFSGPAEVAFNHDLLRGTGPRYWVMEQQAGMINWTAYNPPVPPGQVRIWTLQGLLHGAEAVIYFRWRAGLSGSEQYHSGLLKHSAAPDRGYGEVQALAHELRVGPTLGPRPPAAVALLWSFDDLWAVETDRHHADFQYRAQAVAIYTSLWEHGLTVDILPRHTPAAGLAAYPLVIVPAAVVDDPAWTDELVGYVSNGGALLLNLRAGVRTTANTSLPIALPGSLAALVGATVSEILSLPPERTVGVQTAAGLLRCPLWAETLEPSDPATRVVWHYAEPPAEPAYYVGQAALTRRPQGSGAAYYLGTYPTPAILAALWTGPLTDLLPGALPPSPHLERFTHTVGDTTYQIILNHSDYAQPVPLTGRWYDTTGRQVDALTVRGLDSVVLRRET